MKIKKSDRANSLLNIHINLNYKSNQFSSDSSTITKDDLEYNTRKAVNMIYHISRSKKAQHSKERGESEAKHWMLKTKRLAWKYGFSLCLVTLIKQSV